ncbi:MAG: RusA family crossover junction endodeoxyribonuclease [Rhodospirillaceae bacterium]
MSVEIEFPLEFIVLGTPVSVQAKRRDSIIAWKGRVKEASCAALPEGHFSTNAPISVTLFYFPETDVSADIDNIIKPILDALKNHIYADDNQVERILIQKFKPEEGFRFKSPSVVLSKALDGIKPVLYVKLSDDPAEGAL